MKTVTFIHSAQYWDDRYKSNGNSGAGAYGNLAKFKATVINNFVNNNNIRSVVEFGCGDGNQLSLANYPLYIGYDVSQRSIELCREKFKDDTTKTFLHLSKYHNHLYDLSLSLDVIYHLIEDAVYADYISRLFSSSSKYVIVYSSNNKSILSTSPHVKHRSFIDDVPLNFKCIETIKNLYPYNINYPETTSFSDFYIFKRQ